MHNFNGTSFIIYLFLMWCSHVLINRSNTYKGNSLIFYAFTSRVLHPGARATQRLRPRVASATSTITATVGPTSTRGCAEATTPGMGDATTAGRIGVPRPSHPVRRPSAEPYDGRRSRPGSDPRLLSRSTRGRRDRNCGSRTTVWPVNWVERTMTTSSSATSPCSSPTPLAPGWSTCLRGRSPTGTT
jgi:hypothetical protein